MSRGEPVQRVDERSRPERSQQPSERPGQPELGEDRDASSAVARNRRAVPEDEPPALAPLLLGHGGEQTVGLLVGEREQG